ncbi:galactokinase [Euzebya rosea]|uniref:galactokinase n=1 Tax=Euzebya rosea TaxID=2052804 RepID=UPI001472D64A|nr:galactokinase [Euzebya rosea]
MRRVTAWAPGRVNLIGEHTDHTDGLALPMALDVGVRLEGEVGGDRVQLRSADAPVPVDIPADGSSAPSDGWGRYVAAVAAELHALGRPPVGVVGTVSSTLPQGIGLSSSAALEVAVAVALLRAADRALPAVEVVRACRRAEHAAVGVPSGVLDQAASVLSRSGAALLLDCADLSHEDVALPDGIAVLIIDSGVTRQLEGSGYATRTRELGASLHVLDGRRPADVAVAELAALTAGMDDVPARRLRHVVTENDRVRATVAAFAAADLGTVATLFADSHASLRDDFEVTVPQTDRLVDLLKDNGALASRMTGGGFGGAVIGLVHADEADAVAEATLSAYGRAYPDLRARTVLTRPGAGAAEQAADVLTP